MIQFEWNTKKAAINLKKHSISFDEAKSIFIEGKVKFISLPRPTKNLYQTLSHNLIHITR
ncbi:MAG: BrnT family toxin [Thiofilum sp.]|nr:BrnT family toxin [Thiofilum sp.]